MTTDTVFVMPRWKKVFWFLIFTAMAGLALWLFATTWPLWWVGVQTAEPVVMLYTTSGYLLGGSLFLIVLVVGTMVNLWGGQQITALWRRSEKGVVITCVLLMFLLPWLGNPMIEAYLQDRGYTACPAASTHDFKFSRMAFVRADTLCSAELLQ